MDRAKSIWVWGLTVYLAFFRGSALRQRQNIGILIVPMLENFPGEMQFAARLGD